MKSDKAMKRTPEKVRDAKEVKGAARKAVNSQIGNTARPVKK